MDAKKAVVAHLTAHTLRGHGVAEISIDIGEPPPRNPDMQGQAAGFRSTVARAIAELTLEGILEETHQDGERVYWLTGNAPKIEDFDDDEDDD